MTVVASKEPRRKPKIPPWATEHFELVVNGLEDIGQLVRISERGVSVLRGMPRIVKVLAEVKGEPTDEDSRRRLEIAEKDAARAQTEVDSDFPLLHGLALVAMWSALEHFVKGLVASWILHRKDALEAPVMQRLKVKLGEYVQLSRPEQSRYLVGLLEQELAGPLKRGVGRFETLLDPFSLGGAVPDDCAKAIFELQQVRNVIAHRNGRADKRFRKECPWFKVKLNKPVKISGEILSRYEGAAMQYALTIFYRVGDLYGHDLRQHKAT
jgi:hypothetical protein